MNEFQKIQKARPGELVSLQREFPLTPDPLAFFSAISDYGRTPHSLFLESADIIQKYGERSLGTADPCLKLSGRGSDFSLRALNSLGLSLLPFLNEKLNFCDELSLNENSIRGVLKPRRAPVDEAARLKLPTHADIIRTLSTTFTPVSYISGPYGGLFGAIAYDFIDQFEDLPANAEDPLKDPDYELYYVDNLFIMDHSRKTITFIANALITDGNRDEIYVECMRKLSRYEEILHQAGALPALEKSGPVTFESSQSPEDYMTGVRRLKEHIIEGDIFQAVLARSMRCPLPTEPFSIYRRLRSINPSPYMFFLHSDEGILLGASPEMFLKVEGNEEKVVEIRPIAGTKPRGRSDRGIDPDLDSRFEAELKLDPKELAEHTMLIDLARNDIARISKPGSRFVDEPYVIEKYSHVQHLVSNVRGILRDDLDALHAYLASMNMGTLTGAPKVEAMKLLRQYERERRGYYGGSVGFLTPSGDFDSCIVIRSLRIKNQIVYVHAGAGVVYDSVPEKEYQETENKAAAVIRAIIGDQP